MRDALSEDEEQDSQYASDDDSGYAYSDDSDGMHMDHTDEPGPSTSGRGCGFRVLNQGAQALHGQFGQA